MTKRDVMPFVVLIAADFVGFGVMSSYGMPFLPRQIVFLCFVVGFALFQFMRLE